MSVHWECYCEKSKRLMKREKSLKMMKLKVREGTLSVHLAKIIFANLFYYSAYFCYYLWVPLHFLVLFMDLTVLF